MKNKLSALLLATSLVCGSSQAVILYDQDITPDVIFGSGNANGSFTTEQNNGIELGLRGKLRHNAAGQPENTFNSNGDGTYSFNAGVAPTQSAPTAQWSFEWSINSDYSGDDNFNFMLADLSFVLGLDTDPSLSTDFLTFDPIHGVEPIANSVCWDHSMGDNGTGNGAGTEVSGCRSADAGVAAAATAAYATNLTDFNVAQNSWKPHWFIPGFDPTIDATYDFYLAAFDAQGQQLARTQIQIIVGSGGATQVPAPTPLLLLGIGLLAVLLSRKRVFS